MAQPRATGFICLQLAARWLGLHGSKVLRIPASAPCKFMFPESIHGHTIMARPVENYSRHLGFSCDPDHFSLLLWSALFIRLFRAAYSVGQI